MSIDDLVYIARPATGLVEVCFGSKATDLRRAMSASAVLLARADEVIK